MTRSMLLDARTILGKLCHAYMDCDWTALTIIRFNIPRLLKPCWDINVFNEPEEKDCEHRIKLA